MVRDEAVDGDLVEAGTGRGGAAIFMRGFLEAYELPDARVWVADRFDGRGPRAAGGDPRFTADLNTVRDAFARFDLLDDRTVFRQGPPSRTLAEAAIGEIALLHLGLGAIRTRSALCSTLFTTASPPGASSSSTPTGRAACQDSVDDFRAEHGIVDQLERVDWSHGRLAQGGADGTNSGPRFSRRRRREPVRLAANGRTKDLAVVVVMHNMRREAARTLHSLSRSYQRGIDDLDYEVVVVENGSAPNERAGRGVRAQLRPRVPLRRPRRRCRALARAGDQSRYRRLEQRGTWP